MKENLEEGVPSLQSSRSVAASTTFPVYGHGMLPKTKSTDQEIGWHYNKYYYATGQSFLLQKCSMSHK